MATPPPNITLSMSEFNRLLARRETAQMAAMASRWRQQEMALESAMRRLADAIELRRNNGLPIGPTALTHLTSYKDLLTQVQAQSRSYEDFAKANIMAEQMAYGQLGIDAANAQIARAGVTTAFNRVNIAAVQNMVGLTADGSPLFDVLKKRALSPDMVGGLTDKLIEAVSLGYNPRKTAEMMADGLAQGLTKALTIARTEQIRVFRQATQDQYKETGFIEQWQRHAVPQERTCMGCLALDGKISPVNDDIESHPNCRCFYTPIIPGFTPPDSTSGEGWLSRQNEATQKKILGGHYDAWKAGTPLSDMVKITNDKTWGPTIGIVPVKDLGEVLQIGSDQKAGNYAEAIATMDKHAIKNAYTVPGKQVLPDEMTEDEYNSLLVIYRGNNNLDESDYAFFTQEKDLAEQFGKVTSYRVLPGAKIYPDPEIEGQEDRTLNGLESLRHGSAVLRFSDIVRNYKYSVWQHR